MSSKKDIINLLENKERALSVMDFNEIKKIIERAVKRNKRKQNICIHENKYIEYDTFPYGWDVERCADCDKTITIK